MGENHEKKLLDRVRDAIRRKHYSIRTEEAYTTWIKRFILFHNVRHPLEMGVPEIEGFFTHLAVDRNVAASTRTKLSAHCSFCTRACSGRIWSDPLMLCGPKSKCICRS